jgi:hypothetical protein
MQLGPVGEFLLRQAGLAADGLQPPPEIDQEWASFHAGKIPAESGSPP